MSYSRIRQRSQMKTTACTLQGFVTDRYPSCSNALAERQYAFNSFNVMVGKMETMSDYVTPGYHRRSRSGEVFFSPMSSVSYEVDGGGGSSPTVHSTTYGCSGSTQYQAAYRWTLSGATLGRTELGVSNTFVLSPNSMLAPYVDSFDPRDVSSALTEASTRALADRGNSQSNLWESLAEAEKSAGMLHDALNSLNKFADKNRKTIGRAKAAGDAYLLYRYGLLPLLLDVQAAVDGMSKAVGRVRKTSRGSVTLTRSYITTEIGFNVYGPVVVDRRSTWNETLVLRATSLDEYSASIGSNMGFTLKGLVSLPWELVPYSFVVDWLLNIGDFINAIIPAFGVSQLGSCITREGSLSRYIEMTNPRPISGYAIDSPPSAFLTELRHYKTRLPGPLSSGVVIKSDFRLTSATRLLDALALTVQKFR